MEKIILKYSEASAYLFACVYICVCMSMFVYFYSIVCRVSIAL